MKLPDNPPNTYEELCQLYLPRPIRSERQHKVASRVLDWIAVRAVNLDHEDYASVLGDIVNEYEEELERKVGRSRKRA